MYKDADFYNLAMSVSGATWGALSRLQRPDSPAPEPPPLLRVRAGRAESPGWYLVQALEFDPEPVSVAKLRVRDIYASDRIAFALLEMMASEKWLERINESDYVLTAEGRALASGRRDRLAGRLGQLTNSATDTGRLAKLLERVIAASLQAPNPPGTWCLRHSRRRAPIVDAPPLVHIQHYWADLNAFRDDAHMAAFKPYDIAGFAWEAFTFVCDGTAASAPALFSLLHYRGYSPTEYAAALAGLAVRGWLVEVAEASGRYQTTPEGSAIRERVEAATNAFFYGPWSVLKDEEIAELHQLMVALQNECQLLATGAGV